MVETTPPRRQLLWLMFWGGLIGMAGAIGLAIMRDRSIPQPISRVIFYGSMAAFVTGASRLSLRYLEERFDRLHRQE